MGSKSKSRKRQSPSPRKDEKHNRRRVATNNADVRPLKTPQEGSEPQRQKQHEPSSSTISLPVGRKFLTSQDSGFANYVEEHYPGFVHQPQSVIPKNFHVFAKAALERLRDANYYQYDIVMAGGKHSSRTFVKRTLVGIPGITYKYLGLRLFAHSWSGTSTPSALAAIKELNEKMIQMTKLAAASQTSPIGNCDYNLTLINYMEPTSHVSVGFKEEANYGMGKVSVSWHADSSLESGSAIGVYHCLPTQRAGVSWDWKIALRPSQDPLLNTAGGLDQQSKLSSALPIAINTKDGDAYFMLGDFNENYQHCVLAGSQANRISTTHRVAVTKEDTYDYILKRVKIARKRFRQQLVEAVTTAIDAKVIRYCQQVLTEVEMEWIAQYWLQGAQHDKMHVWWQRPMKTLEAYWGALEEASYELFELCVSDARVPVNVVKVLILEFKNRQSLREQWDERRADKIYHKRISLDYRPMARPLFESDMTATDSGRKGNRLPKDLTSAIQDLTKVLGTCGEHKKKTTKIASMAENDKIPAALLDTRERKEQKARKKRRLN
jgi:alpha-ketoglutarate-dependent dioxygenase FTO